MNESLTTFLWTILQSLNGFQNYLKMLRFRVNEQLEPFHEEYSLTVKIYVGYRFGDAAKLVWFFHFTLQIRFIFILTSGSNAKRPSLFFKVGILQIRLLVQCTLAECGDKKKSYGLPSR